MESARVYAAAGAATVLTVGTAALLLARGSRGVAEPEEEQAQLCNELRGMRLAALRSRALAMGIDEEGVDDAMEAENPKAKLIEVLVKHVEPKQDVPTPGLAYELGQMKLMALHKRALSAGIDNKAVVDKGNQLSFNRAE